MKFNIPQPFVSKRVVEELKTQVGELQHDIEILVSGAVESKSYKGNPYTTAKSAITALAKMYEGTADWGVQQARNIIDLRAAFTIGQGVKATLKKPAKESRELEYIEEFIEHNNLDEEMPQELAKEAEIEGRFLCRLIPNKAKKQIDLRYISYSTTLYEVKASPDDYQKYEKVVCRLAKSDEVTLKEGEFVYKKFSGRIHKVNELMPKVAMVIRHMEDLDKALWDLRRINKLFASPTPYFKCTNKEEVDKLYDKLLHINWKIGKLLITTAEYNLVGLDGSGVEALEKEIITLAKIISGAVGIPVHFLGLPELMSNRAVSTDLFELINASTNKERHVWVGTYEEIFTKVLEMANKNFQKGFKTNLISAEINHITESKMKELVEIWLPLYMENVVDLDFFIKKIPDADPEKIKKANEESAIKILEGIKEKEKEKEVNHE